MAATARTTVGEVRKALRSRGKDAAVDRHPPTGKIRIKIVDGHLPPTRKQ
jgi:hypothetical protein